MSSLCMLANQGLDTNKIKKKKSDYYPEGSKVSNSVIAKNAESMEKRKHLKKGRWTKEDKAEIEALGEYVYEYFKNKCIGPNFNSNYGINYDVIYEDYFTEILSIPITINWETNIIEIEKTIKGAVRIDKKGVKTWELFNAVSVDNENCFKMVSFENF
jgi:hypothetical protein